MLVDIKIWGHSMARLVVFGGEKLSGEIEVSGSKNAALPIIFSCITVYGVSRLDGVPDILDVRIALRILQCFGAVVTVEGNSILIDTRCLTYTPLPRDLTSALRASTYLIGACLVRFGRADLTAFGGCALGSRPIDMHISCAESFGASLCDCALLCNSLSPADIHFKKISVGATVNALILAASTDGESRIYGFAKEPHVFSLIDFLRSAGADITVCETFIRVYGKRLHGADAVIIPDMIEAGTYLSLSLASSSDITVVGANPDELTSFLSFFKENGADVDIGSGFIRAKGELLRFAHLVTAPYPGFPTDLHPQCAPMLSRFSGGRIIEGVWRERFSYLSELSHFGLVSEAFDGGAVIYPSLLHCANAKCTDLRGGAALLISALMTKGESVIDNAELLFRGYADIVKKLSRIGARIYEAD